MGKCNSFSKKDNPQNPNLEDPDVRIVHKDVKIQRNKGKQVHDHWGQGKKPQKNRNYEKKNQM